MSPFTNILLIGASGSIGKVMLQALLASPTITLTILLRASSKPPPAPLPATVKLLTVSDAYTPSELTAAFRGQDAIVNCMTTLHVAAQVAIIDAAIAAGVRRYVPSEYGPRQHAARGAGPQPRLPRQGPRARGTWSAGSATWSGRP